MPTMVTLSFQNAWVQTIYLIVVVVEMHDVSLEYKMDHEICVALANFHHEQSI